MRLSSFILVGPLGVEPSSLFGVAGRVTALWTHLLSLR